MIILFVIIVLFAENVLVAIIREFLKERDPMFFVVGTALAGTFALLIIVLWTEAVKQHCGG